MARAEPRTRTWAKIGVFTALTALGSSLFWFLGTGKSNNLTLVTGVMWCPGLAAIATKWLFGESPREMKWRWASGRYEGLAYLIPFLYALPVYIIIWLTGLGGFYDHAFAAKVATDYGLSRFPGPVALIGYLLISLTAGFIAKMGRALGEEIGWRGFLVPELAKVTSFTGIGIISGLMWAVWHYPAILFSDYNAGTPAWYALICFTVSIVAAAFIAARLTLTSNSLWPAAVLHASHNMLIQLILTPLTTNTGRTAYIIDEFGVGLAISTTVVAIIVCRRRGVSLRPASPTT